MYINKIIFFFTYENSEEQSMTVNITPSQPRVMQYTMKEKLRAVRIEAESRDDSCMVLAIQNIKVIQS